MHLETQSWNQFELPKPHYAIISVFSWRFCVEEVYEILARWTVGVLGQDLFSNVSCLRIHFSFHIIIRECIENVYRVRLDLEGSTQGSLCFGISSQLCIRARCGIPAAASRRYATASSYCPVSASSKPREYLIS
jgi:hypothetical protein